MEDDFNGIKEKYKEARLAERRELVAALEDKNYNVIKAESAGRGRKNYKSGKNRLDPPYDLSNHMWIEADKNGVKILISLNPNGIDSNSSNYHNLYDRIGIQLFFNDNTEPNIRTDMIITGYELPLSKVSRKNLVDNVDKMVGWFCGAKEINNLLRE